MGIFSKIRKRGKNDRTDDENTRRQSRLERHIKTEANSKYSLSKDIRTSPLAIKVKADLPAREYILEHCKQMNPDKIFPGQLIVFEYFEPKYQDELEYYDASPCTLFFGTYKSKEGMRVLGFNIHYYPPRIRKNVMATIFDIYKPVYVKYFNKGISREIDAFDFQYIMDSLKKAKLDFGIRMYIPDLIGKIWEIKPNEWNVAVYTEGWFKKRTQAAILKYWRTFKSKYQ